MHHKFAQLLFIFLALGAQSHANRAQSLAARARSARQLLALSGHALGRRRGG